MIDKFKLQLTAGVILIGITIMACKKTEQITNKNQTISPDILTSIGQLGFNTDNVIMRKEGYLVEGDILLTDDNLKQKSQSPNLRIAECEQYRTINMVRAPRVINVAVFNNLPGIFFQAADSAIARYNALHLSIRFQRVATEGDINIIGFDEAPDATGYITLGYSGFPTNMGTPYSLIQVNINEHAYGPNTNIQYLTTVLTHEMGHCIGFRHTDYMNRAYSCNGPRINEGQSNIGSIRIPGTPSKPDADSWMLACSNGGNRAFNRNDIVALKYLYIR